MACQVAKPGRPCAATAGAAPPCSSAVTIASGSAATTDSVDTTGTSGASSAKTLRPPQSEMTSLISWRPLMVMSGRATPGRRRAPAPAPAWSRREAGEAAAQLFGPRGRDRGRVPSRSPSRSIARATSSRRRGSRWNSGCPAAASCSCSDWWRRAARRERDRASSARRARHRAGRHRRCGRPRAARGSRSAPWCPPATRRRRRRTRARSGSVPA